MRRILTFSCLGLLAGIAILAYVYFRTLIWIKIDPAVAGLGSTISLSISDWKKPIYFENGKMQDSTASYKWLTAFEAVNAVPPLSYEKFVEAVSKEYISEYHFSETQYNAIAKEALNVKGVSKVTVRYFIEVGCASGDYIFIVTSSNSSAAEAPNPNDLYLSLEKRIDGKWKMVPSNPSDPILTIPWNNPAILQEIISSRKAHLSKEGKLMAN